MFTKSTISIFDALKIPEKYIPHGYYCFDDAMRLCPFWDSRQGEYPENEDGFCHFLNKSDWDLNEKSDPIIKSSNDKAAIGKRISEVFNGNDEIDSISGKKIHMFGMSLIWDQCKECGINRDDLDDSNIVTIST